MNKPLRIISLILFLFSAGVGSAFSADKDALDWTVWRNLPVFEGGRLMPLDTFARETVEAICGRTNPTLSLADALPDADADAPEYAEAKKLFPTGGPRKFAPEELLFSWLVEPERWEQVPFLAAENKQLRQEVLNLPLFDKQGRRLRYASLKQVENCPELGRRWAELQVRAESEGAKFNPVGVDKHVKELIEAYGRYRNLTCNPQSAQEVSRRFIARLRNTADAWKKLDAELRQSGALKQDEQSNPLLEKLDDSFRQLIALVHGGEFTLETVEPAAAAFHRTAEQLGGEFIKGNDKVLASLAADLIHQAEEMHAALYDDGGQLRLVPALNSGALEENRTSDDDAQPWLGLQTLLTGSDSLMRSYPQAGLQHVRRSFAGLAAAYTDRGNPKRPEKFQAAMNEFTAALRRLGAEVEPLRRRLPVLQKDEILLDSTAYPPEGFARLEVFYNSLNPFFWSWLLSLIALGCLALAVGVFRKPLFWLAVALLAAGQAITLLGFGLRAHITGLVPLTGMFETTVFVALCVAVLGLWFALLPIVWPGWQLAWRLTSLPGCLNYRTRLRKNHANPVVENEPSWAGILQWLNLIFRACITYWLFVKLVIFPGLPGVGYFNLLPKTNLGESLPAIGSLMVWIVGWCVLLVGLYYLPRLIPAAAMSLFTIPYAMFIRGWREPLAQAIDRKAFVLAGAAACFLAALAAYFAPPEIMHKGFDSPRPILRDNFWLFVHVLTITASYGAGALAWGLGNIALGYYLLGRYRDADSSSISPALTLPLSGHQPKVGREMGLMENSSRHALARRPPEICATLAGFIYKATQVAVLLLAAGTILGALWADVAWGRFWGWDAKEVWALVSLLVYMTVLHGRYAGWSGNFGLAVGSVLGATAILMAWYGVNFFLGSGLHSYASGAGGQWEVGMAIVINWIFVLAAAFRYRLETGTPAIK
jgi:ABC-type transport system involved in cytochrome c biogenesis permease subunit